MNIKRSQSEINEMKESKKPCEYRLSSDKNFRTKKIGRCQTIKLNHLCSDEEKKALQEKAAQERASSEALARELEAAKKAEKEAEKKKEAAKAQAKAAAEAEAKAKLEAEQKQQG